MSSEKMNNNKLSTNISNQSNGPSRKFDTAENSLQDKNTNLHNTVTNTLQERNITKNHQNNMNSNKNLLATNQDSGSTRVVINKNNEIKQKQS